MELTPQFRCPRVDEESTPTTTGKSLRPEGHVPPAPRAIIHERDTKIQTVADLMQLVRVIEGGMGAAGDPVPLDPSRIYYLGRSYGANVGAVFLSAEPSVRAGVLTSPGGALLEGFRLSPAFRPIVGTLLAARSPSLINIAGVEFNENLPLRDEPPIVNTIAGADEIQELIDKYEWVAQGGDAVPYGVHLRRAPLRGVEPKSTIIQFARGDRTLPNPTATAVLRAGDSPTALLLPLRPVLGQLPDDPPSINDPHQFILTPPPFVTMPSEVRAAVDRRGVCGAGPGRDFLRL